VQVVGDYVGVDALRGKQLGEDGLVLGDRGLPVGLEAVVADGVPVPEGQVLTPVWMARLARMVGIDSG
jgi:hypothetical protein